jgi:hypothetical protein
VDRNKKIPKTAKVANVDPLAISSPLTPKKQPFSNAAKDFDGRLSSLCGKGRFLAIVDRF